MLLEVKRHGIALVPKKQQHLPTITSRSGFRHLKVIHTLRTIHEIRNKLEMKISHNYPMPSPNLRSTSCQYSLIKPVNTVITDQNRRQEASITFRLYLSAAKLMNIPANVYTTTKTGPATI